MLKRQSGFSIYRLNVKIFRSYAYSYVRANHYVITAKRDTMVLVSTCSISQCNQPLNLSDVNVMNFHNDKIIGILNYIFLPLVLHVTQLCPLAPRPPGQNV